MNTPLDLPITDVFFDSSEFLQGLKILFLKKSKKKTFLKAAEELNELSTKIIQWVNDNDKVSDEDIVEEIVDVQMHLLTLQQHFSQQTCHDMALKKIKKFIDSKDFIEYKNQYLKAQ